MQNFMKEMDIMKKLNHPNLVKMYGICVDKMPFFIILVRSMKNVYKNMYFRVTGFLLLSFLSQENCSKGDLKKHLESFKQGTGELIRGG